MSRRIAKEELPDVRIIPAFVDDSERWRAELQTAARLGNEFKGKTAITFETMEGPCSVETTVWSVTDTCVHLKSGATIPLNAVIDVHY